MLQFSPKLRKSVVEGESSFSVRLFCKFSPNLRENLYLGDIFLYKMSTFILY